MAAPTVRVSEIDLSTRVPTYPGVFGGMVGPLEMGDTDKAFLTSSFTDLIKKTTPFNQLQPNYSNIYYSAQAYLSRSNKLWLVRVVGQNALFGGVVLMPETSTTESASFSTGYTSKAAILGNPGVTGIFSDDYADAYCALIQKNVGKWGNQFLIDVVPWRAVESPTRIKETVSKGYTTVTLALGVYDGNVNTVENTIDLGITTLVTGNAVMVSVDGGALPAGLSAATFYYLKKVGSTTEYTFHTTYADAIAGTNAIALTDDGSGDLTVDLLIDVTTATKEIKPINWTEWVTGVPIKVVSVGTLPVPLITGTTYYVRKTATGLQLFDTSAHALATSSVTGLVSISTQGDGSLSIQDPAVVDVVNDTLTLSQNWVQGEAVKIRVKGSGTMPSPLVSGTTYYAVPAGGGKFNLATSRANAIAETPITIDLTTKGAGELSIEAIDKVSEPYCFRIDVYSKKQRETEALESWVCSLDETYKNGFGKNIYIENVLKSSNYIDVVMNPLTAVDQDTVEYPANAPEMPMNTCFASDGTISIAGGSNGDAITEGDYITAVRKFQNKIDYPMTVIMDGGYHAYDGGSGYENEILAIAEQRKDCVGFLSTPIECEEATDYVSSVLDWVKDTLSTSSYGAVFFPHVKVEDATLSTERIISPDAFAGAAISNAALNYSIWFPIAGNKRGRFVGVSDVNVKVTDAEADLLYDNNINVVKFNPNKGVRLISQKTLYSTPSKLNYINVRLLMIVIETALADMLEDYLQEFNTPASRSLIVANINAYLGSISAKDGIIPGYTAISDTTNNTQNDIDNNILNIDMAVSPTGVIENVNLRIAITNSGVSVSLA